MEIGDDNGAECYNEEERYIYHDWSALAKYLLVIRTMLHGIIVMLSNGMEWIVRFFCLCFRTG